MATFLAVGWFRKWIWAARSWLEKCYAWVEKIGRTSMKICVDVWVTRYRTGERVKVTNGVFTYVALGPDGKPVPVKRD